MLIISLYSVIFAAYLLLYRVLFVQYKYGISMDITARYAQQLHKDKLQENTINSYISDVRQFMVWKDMFSPNSRVDEALLSQYLKTSSFTRSKFTMRRKEISLKKFLQWTNTNSARSKSKPKYLASSTALILLLLPLALQTNFSSLSYDNLEYASINKDYATTAVTTESPIDISVEGVEVAVSGYEIQAPIQDSSAEVVLSLQNNLEEESPDTLESLSPIGGTEQIKQGASYTIIYNDSIDADSLIIVTATAPSHGETLFIQSQGEGYAVVAIERPIDSPLPFNWIAI
jgi:hypothetical protein